MRYADMLPFLILPFLIEVRTLGFEDRAYLHPVLPRRRDSTPPPLRCCSARGFRPFRFRDGRRNDVHAIMPRPIFF